MMKMGIIDFIKLLSKLKNKNIENIEKDLKIIQFRRRKDQQFIRLDNMFVFSTFLLSFPFLSSKLVYFLAFKHVPAFGAFVTFKRAIPNFRLRNLRDFSSKKAYNVLVEIDISLKLNII